MLHGFDDVCDVIISRSGLNSRKLRCIYSQKLTNCVFGHATVVKTKLESLENHQNDIQGLYNEQMQHALYWWNWN